MNRKKRFLKRTSAVITALLLVAALTFPTSAAVKTQKHFFGCRGHGYSCGHVGLSCDYTGKKINSTWFSSSQFHFPNGVNFGTTGSGSGYARGTYTVYSGLVTDWFSLTFSSYTDTIYIYV